MARLFTNPYSGQVLDYDAIPAGKGGGKFCPMTNQPLDAKALEGFDHTNVAHPDAKKAAYDQAAAYVADIAAQIAA